MARLSDRLTELERVKKVGVIQMPLIIVKPDEGWTDEHQRQIDEAESIGRNVIMIRRASDNPNIKMKSI